MLSKISNIFFTNQTTSQTIVKNTFWLGVSQIASRLLRVAIVIYAARLLGAYDYGVFAYALGISGILSVIFSDIGVNRILVKEAIQSPNKRLQYIATAFAIKMVLLLFTGLILVGIAPYFSKIVEAKILLPITALLLILDGIRDFGYAVIRSLEKMEWEALVNVITNITTILMAGIAITYQPTPMVLIIAYTTASFIGTSIIAIGLRRTIAKIKVNFQSNLIKPIMINAWPFAVINLLWSAVMYTDIIMLGWLTTATEVGFYSAAQRPIQLLLALPAVISASILPSLSRFANQNQEKFKQVMEQALAITMLIAFPLMAGGMALAQQLIPLVYGTDYIGAIAPFQLLAASILITFPTLLIYHAIIANNLQKKFILQMATGAIMNIALNWWLIPREGVVGAALATIISQFIAYGWIYINIQKTFRFSLLPKIYRIIFATIIMVAAIEFSRLANINIYLIVIISVASYGASLIILKDPLINRFRNLWKNATT